MSTKNLILAIVFSVFVIFGILVYQLAKFNDGKLHLVFCDVGQGDAIFVRTSKGVDILFDGGPNDSILSCLKDHMPFWDRDLELVILTHPHADHLKGLISVAKRYKMISFATENLKNNTAIFKALMNELKNQNIKMQYLYAGDRFVFKDRVSLDIVGPSRKFLEKTSPTGVVGERNEFANIESLFRYKDFSVLLTGDSQVVELNDAFKTTSLSVLQVPHHGSKTGLDERFLAKTKPKLAVISVGKNNKYGHPASQILKILRDQYIKILRTDKDGEIEIVSDGVSWEVKK